MSTDYIFNKIHLDSYVFTFLFLFTAKLKDISASLQLHILKQFCKKIYPNDTPLEKMLKYIFNSRFCPDNHFAKNILKSILENMNSSINKRAAYNQANTNFS